MALLHSILKNFPTSLQTLRLRKLLQLKGIGDSTAKKIAEMLETGKLGVLSEYIEKTPPGVIEMLNIKGIGPKKFKPSGKKWELNQLVNCCMHVMKIV